MNYEGNIKQEEDEASPTTSGGKGGAAVIDLSNEINLDELT
jgi:hypothetical protein